MNYVCPSSGIKVKELPQNPRQQFIRANLRGYKPAWVEAKWMGGRKKPNGQIKARVRQE
jgi:hypothetical protein